MVDGFPPIGGWSECSYAVLETHISMILKNQGHLLFQTQFFRMLGQSP